VDKRCEISLENAIQWIFWWGANTWTTCVKSPRDLCHGKINVFEGDILPWTLRNYRGEKKRTVNIQMYTTPWKQFFFVTSSPLFAILKTSSIFFYFSIFQGHTDLLIIVLTGYSTYSTFFQWRLFNGDIEQLKMFLD